MACAKNTGKQMPMPMKGAPMMKATGARKTPTKRSKGK